MLFSVKCKKNIFGAAGDTAGGGYVGDGTGAKNSQGLGILVGNGNDGGDGYMTAPLPFGLSGIASAEDGADGSAGGSGGGTSYCGDILEDYGINDIYIAGASGGNGGTGNLKAANVKVGNDLTLGASYSGSGGTQFSLSFCDFAKKNEGCWDILRESGVAEATPSDLPANCTGGRIDAWKRRNLASALLACFGINPEDSDEEEENENFAGQVTAQRDAILGFARRLLSTESGDSNKISAFDKKILDLLNGLKFDELDEQPAGNTEIADALAEILEEIRRESDIFRSNESLQFSLGLLRAAHEGDTALQNFLNSWLINQAQASATEDADADGNYEDGSGNFGFVPIDLSNVKHTF
jgi:hypothetical protein